MTTLQTTQKLSFECGTTLFIDILENGEYVGEATVVRYHGENVNREYARLDRIVIDEDYRGKGHGSAAIEAMRKEYGRIVAPQGGEEVYFRVGLGAHEFC